jgi:hypothetical protein
LHRKCLSDNITYATLTREIPTIDSLQQLMTTDYTIECFCRYTVQKKQAVDHLVLCGHWMLSFESNDSSKENRQTLIAPRNFCFNYVRVKMFRRIVSKVYDHNFNKQMQAIVI